MFASIGAFFRMITSSFFTGEYHVLQLEAEALSSFKEYLNDNGLSMDDIHTGRELLKKKKSS